MANRNLSRVILLGGLSVNLNHLKRLPVKNKEIKLFPIENALSKQIPLKVNGFAETSNFPHLLR